MSDLVQTNAGTTLATCDANSLSAPLVKSDAEPSDYAIAQARLCQGEVKQAPEIIEGSLYETEGFSTLFEAEYDSGERGKPAFQSYTVGPFIPLFRLEEWSLWQDGKMLGRAPTEGALAAIVGEEDMDAARRHVDYVSVFPDEIYSDCLSLRFTPASGRAAASILTREKSRALQSKGFGAYTLSVLHQTGGGIQYFKFAGVKVEDPTEELSKKAQLWRQILGGKAVSTIDESEAVTPADGRGTHRRYSVLRP